jgi:hypothetical protein
MNPEMLELADDPVFLPDADEELAEKFQKIMKNGLIPSDKIVLRVRRSSGEMQSSMFLFTEAVESWHLEFGSRVSVVDKKTGKRFLTRFVWLVVVAHFFDKDGVDLYKPVSIYDLVIWNKSWVEEWIASTSVLPLFGDFTREELYPNE